MQAIPSTSSYIILIVCLLTSIPTQPQTVEEYVDYIQTKGMDPKEYIFEAFKKHDVVILGERDHRDTTQYDFILDVLADPRFINGVGYVYTEVGVVNRTDEANRLIKGNYASYEDFYSAFVQFYRNMDYEILWEKYNASKFILGLYATNKELPAEKKITWGLTDRPWDWAKAVYEGGEYSYSTVYGNRDKIMADNFLEMFRAQPLRDGKRKALLITNAPHAVKGKLAGREKKEGYYITKELGEKRVKVILMNWYDFIGEDELFADGAWDAAFERTGCKPVAVDFHDSPFGRIKQKNWGRWNKIADGMIFYVPFYMFVSVIGVPGIFGDDFIEEYKRRRLITTQRSTSDKDVQRTQDYYNNTRTVPCCDYEERQMEQLQRKLQE